MSDEEMLMLAGKAFGIGYLRPYAGDNVPNAFVIETGAQVVWDPLHNIRDSYFLMVAASLRVHANMHLGEIKCDYYDAETGAWAGDVSEPALDGSAAIDAAMRAIARGAAEVGRAMP